MENIHFCWNKPYGSYIYEILRICRISISGKKYVIKIEIESDKSLNGTAKLSLFNETSLKFNEIISKNVKLLLLDDDISEENNEDGFPVVFEEIQNILVEIIENMII